MRRFVLFAPLGLCLAGGCMVGPNYTAPDIKFAANYADLPPVTSSDAAARIVAGSAPAPQWWRIFGDPELDSLMERAEAGNLDLQQALSRVRQARAQRSGLAAGLWPELDASGGYYRARGSQNVILPFGSPSAGGSATPTATAPTRKVEDTAAPSSDSPAPVASSAPAGGAAPLNPLGEGGFPGVTTSLYQAGFDAAWEIDIFGGSRRALQGADAGIAAAEESRRMVLVSLLAEVATTYLDLRATQERERLARDQLTVQRETLDLVGAKFHAGFATELDVLQQRTQVETTAALLPPLATAERVARHLLAFLIGAPPEALAAELTPVRPLPALPAELPVGVPSDLLRRRPDVRRAERQLAQATAGVGVATADLFPKFSLTGMAGVDSSDARHLGDWSSRYYAISPGISWPILDWGRVRANLRLQNERQQEAFLAYRGAILGALKDVEDALVQFDGEQLRHTSLTAAATAARRAHALARLRYAHGLTDLLTLLTAEHAKLQTEDALAQSDGALRHQAIALCKALGGGWE